MRAVASKQGEVVGLSLDLKGTLGSEKSRWSELTMSPVTYRVIWTTNDSVASSQYFTIICESARTLSSWDNSFGVNFSQAREAILPSTGSSVVIVFRAGPNLVRIENIRHKLYSRTKTSNISELILLTRRELYQLIHHENHLSFADDFDELTQAESIRRRCKHDCIAAKRRSDLPFDSLVLHFRDPILHKRQDLLEDFRLSGFVSQEAARISLDLVQQIIETHVTKRVSREH